MAPRKPKPSDNDDAASTTSTDPTSTPTPSVLKPNTTKAKVEKPAAKPKTTKPKAPKKTTAVDGESEEKEKKVVKKAVKKDVEGGGKAGDKGGEKGEKVKTVTGEEAVQVILGYLRAQNRPYSATEISANLHGKVTKTNADKLLKEMEQNGQIMGKATKKDGGGQWVFWPVQDPSDAASPTELASMDTQITTLKDSNPLLKTTLKNLSTKLTTLKSAPTTPELTAIISKLQADIKEKKDKLEGYKTGAVKIVTKEELERVEKEWKYWGTKRRVRKAAFQNLEGELLEGMSREEVWERAGLEEDCM